MANPKKFRRLTRAEASRLGKSYGAKHQVDASLKRVTKATKTYTNRKAQELRTGRKREVFARERVEVRPLKSGGVAIEYKNLSKQNLMKLLKKYRKKIVLLKFHGQEGSRRAEYKGHDISTSDDDQWFTAHERINADELLDSDEFEQYLEDSDVSGTLKFSLIVYGT